MFGMHMPRFLKAHALWFCVCLGMTGSMFLQEGDAVQHAPKSDRIELPAPQTDGRMSLEFALFMRRSVRSFQNHPLSLASVSQLLWAAQGITNSMGLRTAPSAGALYPLEVYVFAGNVEGVSAGLYRYNSQGHQLDRLDERDRRDDLCRAALGQAPVRQAPAAFMITGVGRRITAKYGNRGIRYMLMEAGHVAQNICLQATALDLGAVVIGAFSDREAADILKLDSEESPLYIIAVGKP